MVCGLSVLVGGSVVIIVNGEGGDGYIFVQGSDIKVGVDVMLKVVSEVWLVVVQEILV